MTDHDDIKSRAALASIAASALLTLGKLAAGLLSGSLALISEAGHGLLDTGATILTYFAVRASRADDLRIDTDGFEVETLINIRAHRAGLAIAEVPCFEGNRIHGASNLSAVKDGIRIARLILRERIGGHRGA